MTKILLTSLGVLWILSACSSDHNTYLASLQTSKITLPSGEVIEAFLATSTGEQLRGLSSLPESEFSKNQGMLFVYPDEKGRSFWMPDTYFDLDIFFLDEDLKVLNIVRDVLHHPGREEPPPIARTPRITSRYVLEMRSDSELTKNIQVQDKFSINSE